MIPLVTTTVTIDRGTSTGDPYESDTVTAVATDVDAHISGPSGSDQRVGGSQEVVDAVLLAPTTPMILRGDQVTDNVTGDAWTVTWVRTRTGLGLAHQRAGLVAVAGGSGG